MLEYSLIKQHRPRFNIRLRDDKSYPFLAITLDEEWPRAMVMRGRKRKGVRYFGPYAHAYAIRETLDLLLRTFPIRTCSPQKFNQHAPAGPAVPAVPHREVLGAVRRRDRPRATTTELVEELIDFLDGDTDDVVQRLERQMQEAADASSTSGRPAAGPPDGGAPGHREAADGGRAQRGPRRHRHRRGRAGGRRPGVLRAPGPGGRAARASSSTRWRTSRPAGWSPAILEELYGDEPALGVPKQVLVPAEPDVARRVRGVADADAGVPGPGAGAAAGRQARAARDGHPQRQGGVHPPRPAPGRRPQLPGPGPQRAAGRARPARGAAAHRVLRHGPHPGHRLRRARWW